MQFKHKIKASFSFSCFSSWERYVRKTAVHNLNSNDILYNEFCFKNTYH
jgi:hypothetical protein